MMATAHGAGLMLVPALIPICMGDASARQITASSSLLLALAAVAVHSAAMLAVTGGVATGVCRGVGAMLQLGVMKARCTAATVPFPTGAGPSARIRPSCKRPLRA